LKIPSKSDSPAFVNRPCYHCLPPTTAVFLPPQGRQAPTKAYLTPAESLNHMVHAVLHEYPVELLSREEIEDNCNQFGYVREISPVAVALSSPDLATVRVVLQLEHPREIPHELRIDYADRSTSVVHVEIVRVWHRDHSYDEDGQYMRLFQPLQTLQAADA
jgi:hypothetical protein